MYLYPWWVDQSDPVQPHAGNYSSHLLLLAAVVVVVAAHGEVSYHFQHAGGIAVGSRGMGSPPHPLSHYAHDPFLQWSGMGDA